MTEFLAVDGLSASKDEKELFSGVSFTVSPGEVHVISGANGAGKSSVAMALAGVGGLEVSGSIRFLGEEISGLSPDERARRGIFLGFQETPEIPGVTVFELISAALSGLDRAISVSDLYHEMGNFCVSLGLPEDFSEREIVGLSGGEKRKLELLQMLMLKPRLAILDEVDSGLDAASVAKLPEVLKKYHGENNSLIIISHNFKFLSSFSDAKKHEMVDGRMR